jgi:hypothetical protein
VVSGVFKVTRLPTAVDVFGCDSRWRLSVLRDARLASLSWRLPSFIDFDWRWVDEGLAIAHRTARHE